MKRIIMLIVVVTFITAGCGGQSEYKKTTGTISAVTDKTFTVSVDGVSCTYNLSTQYPYKEGEQIDVWVKDDFIATVDPTLFENVEEVEGF